MYKIKVGSDFSGVGAFDQSLIKLGIDYETVFACDMDKYARKTFIANYGEPKYYPENVYDREIPTESLDVYMTSPPCQAFSLAGKRKGESDDRGVLFYNSHEFIKVNKPRYFIFENVKGLLSSRSCITYKNCLYLLLYNFKNIDKWESLELQKNNLSLLSQNITNYLCLNYANKLGLKRATSGMYYTTNSGLDYAKLEKTVKSGLKRRLKFLEERICQITKKSNFYQQELTVPLGCKEEDLVLNQNQSYLIENLSPMVISILEKTVDINVNMSLFANNILEDNSRNGRLYTILTELNSTIDKKTFTYVLEMNIIRLIILALDLSSNLWKEIWLILTGKKGFTGLKTFDIWLFNLDHLKYNIHYKVLNAKDFGVPQNRERIFIIGIRDDQDNDFSFPREIPLEKRLRDVLESEVDEKYYLSDTRIFTLNNANRSVGFTNIETKDISNCIIAGYGKIPTDGEYIKVKSATSNGYETAKIGEDSINLEHPNSETRRGRVGKGVAQTLTTSCNQGVLNEYCRIRKITPLECFRLMSFPDTLVKNARDAGVSDSQLYKQAGNSIVVDVLAALISKLKL